MGVRTFEEIRHSIENQSRQNHSEALVALVFKRADPPTCVKIIRPGHWDEVWPSLQIRLEQKNVAKHGKKSMRSEVLVFEPYVFEPNFLTDDGGMYAAIIRNAKVNGLLSCIEDVCSKINHPKAISPSSIIAALFRKEALADLRRKFLLPTNKFFVSNPLRLRWFILLNWDHWNYKRIDRKIRVSQINEANYKCKIGTLNSIEDDFGLRYRAPRAGIGGRSNSKKSIS